MTRTILKSLALGLGLLVVAAVAQAATTGDLRGRVTDAQGAGLPGVTVTLTSENVLGGPWVRVTDADGMYQFPALQPGTYDVRFTLEGFATREREDVRVLLDTTQQLNATMSLATVEEEIVVTAEAPVVDPEQTGTQQVFTNEYLNKAALGSTNRSYQSVLTQSAGVTGGSNPSVFGATLGENAYLIDGITTTDPVTSTFGTNFNFDAIQEVAFNTGGFEAEYGGATGGIVNVITKSGGNTFEGNVDVRYRDSDFFEEGDHFDPDLQDTKFLNPGATLGGPVLRDRLWFFAAYEFTDSQSTPVASPTTREFEGNYYLGKLSFQISDSWRLVGKYSSDPADISNVNASRLRSPQATAFQEQGGDLISGSIDGILTPSMVVDFKVGINRQELNAFPQSQPINGPPAHQNDATGEWTRNYSNAQFSNRDRDEFRGTLTYFLDQLGGSHEFKVGGEFNDLLFSASNNTTANGFWYQDRNGPRILWHTPVTGASETSGDYVAAFAQDAWRITPRITAKLGVRYDQVDFTNDVGNQVADLSKVQPRLGLAWDITGQARTVLRASAGRFMHPSALTLPFYARQDSAPTVAYLSCTTFGFGGPQCQDIFGGSLNVGGFEFPTWIMDPDNTDPNGFLLVPGNVFSSAPSQVQQGLDPMYTEELIFGVEHAFAPRTSVEVSYVDREWHDIFEDTCNGNFPGEPSADADCDFYLFANLPQLRREYQGIIVRLESRDIERLHVVASYTNADSKGSVGYTQNAGADFDIFPEHFVNRFGRDESEHRFKLNGYVDLPLGFTVGFDGFWRSEFPWTPVATAPSYGSQFTEPRGSREGEDLWQLDLELSKYFTFGDVRARLIGTVFNVTSEEAVIDICNAQAFTAGGGVVPSTCGSVPFGQATEWQDPRRYEVGFRLEF